MDEEQVVAVARHGEKVALSAAARAKMEQSRERVQRAAGSREPAARWTRARLCSIFARAAAESATFSP